MFEKGFKGLLDHVFNPLIKSADVKHEASIILNESKRRNKWYPGDDEFEHHRMTKWKSVKIFEARQMTGNESDLSKMTPARLLKLHEAYFDPRVYVIIGGTFDKEIVYKELGKIKTKKHELQTKFEEIKWANKDYHEKKVDNISRFLYHMGGIFPEHDMSVGFAISFIGELLTNTTQGSLMEWLRNDLGWCYDLHLRTDFDTNPIMNNMWELFIPLNSRKQVDYVRKHIHKKILNAISDKKFVAKEVDRQISYRLFMFQTLGSIMNEVGGNLGSHGGKAYTETEYLKLLEKCKDTSYLREIYDKYMSPKVAGEFLAVPK